MKLLLGLFFSFCILCAGAQNNNSATANTQKPFKDGDSIYQAADFPGGTSEWKKFIERNLNPDTPNNYKAPVGVYTVVAGFANDTTGKITDITIFKDPGYGTADDVKHLLNKSPNWLPATINGKPVIYRQKQNFTYQVTEK